MSWRRTKRPPPEPVWVLAVDSCAWIDDGEQVIDGVRVKFTKPGWSWTLLREDLDYGMGRIWVSEPAQTREEALTVGLEKLREHREAHS